MGSGVILKELPPPEDRSYRRHQAIGTKEVKTKGTLAGKSLGLS